MELNLEEQMLIATYRSLDELGKKELLRHATLQHKMEAAASSSGPSSLSGQCKLERGEERPESVAEPIFTE
jgi:hypothetical protein